MAGHPDGNLAELAPHTLSELKKKIPVLLRILDVHEDAHQFITLHFPSMLPLAFYPLSFRGDSAKPAAKLHQRLSNQCIRQRAAIVKPKRQQNLESPAGNAHTSLAPGL